MKRCICKPQRNRTRFTRYDVWIVFKRIGINTCCLGTHPVWAGRKDGYMILQDVPSDGISLAACKTCHNGLKITGYIYQIAVGLNSRAIEAVGSTCFADNHYWRIFFIFVGKISYNCTCQRTNTCLYKYVCRAVNAVLLQLFICFQYQSSISLHDPGRNFLISIPGCILNDDAVFCFSSLSSCHSYTVIVVYFFNGNNSAFLCNVVKTCFGSSLRHSDYSFLSKTIGSPCNPASMVSICSSEESSLSEFFS